MIEYDATLGIIRSVTKGMQSEADNIVYMTALIETVAIAKAHAGRVLHLADGREASVQPATTTEIYATFPSMSEIGIDRVAVVIHSALLKMQTRRVHADSRLEFFSDPETALAWLLDAAAAAA